MTDGAGCITLNCNDLLTSLLGRNHDVPILKPSVPGRTQCTVDMQKVFINLEDKGRNSIPQL